MVNVSDAVSQARVKPGWQELGGDTCRLTDVLSGMVYDRDNNEMLSLGTYVELQPWGFHFLRCRTNIVPKAKAIGA